MSARRAHEQSGFALIEVLISMIVAGLLVAAGAIALVTGLQTSVKSSTDLRRTTALAGYGDLIKGLPYYACVSGVRPRDIATYYTTLAQVERPARPHGRSRTTRRPPRTRRRTDGGRPTR